MTSAILQGFIAQAWRHWRIATLMLLTVAAMTSLFVPSLREHASRVGDRTRYNDDVRHWIVPYFRHTANGPLGSDLSGDYLRDLTPAGYRGLYRGLALTVDPETLSKVLPYVLFAVSVCAVGLSAYALGGPSAAMMSVALALQLPVFLQRMTGGLPRSFAFPLISLGLLAAASGRVWVLASLTVIAVSFYPVAAIANGLILVGVLLMQLKNRNSTGWSAWKSLALLVGVFAASAGMSQFVRTERWGPRLGVKDAVRYAELAPGGRIRGEDRSPVTRFVSMRVLYLEVVGSIERGFVGGGKAVWGTARRFGEYHRKSIVSVLIGVLVVGIFPLARTPVARRMLMLPVAGIAGFVLATALSPALYLPERYTVYTLSIFGAVFLPAAGGAIVAAISSERWRATARWYGSFAVGGAAILFLGGRGDPEIGYVVTSTAQEMHLHSVIAQLPRDVLVAGWPGGVVKDVPYLSRRRAFLTEETHLPFHEAYLVEMRHRMDATLRALLSADGNAVRELRDRFGVTHLIVNEHDFNSPPEYFAPFDTVISRIWTQAQSQGFGIRSAINKATVYRDANLVLLDLSRL